jgi:hypothetical protein
MLTFRKIRIALDIGTGYKPLKNGRSKFVKKSWSITTRLSGLRPQRTVMCLLCYNSESCKRISDTLRRNISFMSANLRTLKTPACLALQAIRRKVMLFLFRTILCSASKLPNYFHTFFPCELSFSCWLFNDIFNSWTISSNTCMTED